MTTIKLLASAGAFCLLTLGAQAQTPRVSTVNITTESGEVRVSAQGDVSDLKIEVTDEAGETVFEGAQEGGQRLVWNMRDSAGEKVRPGDYTVLVSYRTPAGKLRRRVEQVLVIEEVAGAGGEDKAVSRKEAASAPNPQPLLDGGGVLNRVPKFQDGDTLTSSSIMDVGGNISIGKLAAPVAGVRLEINGYTRMNTAGSGGYMQFGTPNGETGFGWIKGTTSRADVRFNGTALTLAAGTGINVPPNTYGIVITTAGRVGIGTAAPAHKLEVNSPGYAVVGRSTGGGAGVYGESAGFNGVRGIGRNVNHGAVVGVHEAGGFAVYGLSSGHGVVGQSTGGGAGVHGESAQFNGVRGIGHNANHGAVVGVHTAGGIALYGTSAGTGVLGESKGGPGVTGLSTSSLGVQGRTNTTSNGGAGVGGYNDAGGWAMYAGGNAGQQRDRGGWVKAMVVVHPDGTVARCFNSQLPDGGASRPPSGKTGCGFTVTGPVATSQYFVNFGFLVSDRFFSITPGFSGSAMAGASLRYPSSASNEVSLFTYIADSGDRAIAQFTVFVF